MSDYVGLNRMLAHHGQEAREWLLEILGQGSGGGKGGIAAAGSGVEES